MNSFPSSSGFLKLVAVLGLSIVPASAAIVFQQDFSGGGVPADYTMSGTASGSLFDDIGADVEEGGPASGYTITIDDGALRMEAGSETVGSQGFYYTQWENDPLQQALFSFTLTLARTNSVSDFGPAATFIIGTEGNTDGPFDSSTSAAGSFLQWTMRATGADWQLENSGEAAQLIDLPYGTAIDFQIALNNSGAPINFLGPDGAIHTVDHQQYSLFYNSGSGWLLAFDSILGRGPYNGNSPEIEGFRFQEGRSNLVATWDNFSVNDTLPVPEPSFVGLLLAMSVWPALKRRRS